MSAFFHNFIAYSRIPSNLFSYSESSCNNNDSWKSLVPLLGLRSEEILFIVDQYLVYIWSITLSSEFYSFKKFFFTLKCFILLYFKLNGHCNSYILLISCEIGLSQYRGRDVDSTPVFLMAKRRSCRNDWICESSNSLVAMEDMGRTLTEELPER